MSITYEQFEKCCIEFVSKPQVQRDGWLWIKQNDKMGYCALNNVIKSCGSNIPQIIDKDDIDEEDLLIVNIHF